MRDPTTSVTPSTVPRGRALSEEEQHYVVAVIERWLAREESDGAESREPRAESRPMPRYIAFLRAVNVGGHVVKMDRLRELFEALGFRDVETFIASGNVVFAARAGDAAALEATIERHLATELGYEVATFLRTPEELAAIAAHVPFAAADPLPDGHALSVGFLKAAPGEGQRSALMAHRGASDDFALHGREVWWWARGRVSDSKFTGARLERAVGAATMRNVTTVRKLAAKYPPSR